MKRARSTGRKPSGELRSEYEFDYTKAKRNPYAAHLKGRAVAVVLDPDVAAVPRRSRGSTVVRRPAVEQVDADEVRAKSTRRRGPRS